MADLLRRLYVRDSSDARMGMVRSLHHPLIGTKRA
jgi:hypothetical protein